MRNGLITIIAALFLFASGYFVSEFTSEPEIKTKTKIDTVYQTQTKVDTIKKAVLDTVKLQSVDTITISKTDTIYKTDSVQIAKDTTQFKQGKLQVQYYFPPANYFQYNWQPEPRPTITEVRRIKVEPKWYENKYLWGAVGVIGGVLIGGKHE